MKGTMRAAAFCAALLSASAAHAAGYLLDRSADIALAKSERAWMCDFARLWNPCMGGPQRTELVAAGRSNHKLSPPPRMAPTGVSNS
jgi:hypothetical protein